MTDRYGYTDGKCYICKENKPVRWKNLYTIGSEGTNLCIECEMKVVNFVCNLARKTNKEKVGKIKELKNGRNYKKDI